MRIVRLIIAVLFATVSIPAVARDADFIKRPKALGKKMSIVHTFTSGTHINCRGSCSNGAQWDYWECPGSIVDTFCTFTCRPVPRAGCGNF